MPIRKHGEGPVQTSALASGELSTTAPVLEGGILHGFKNPVRAATIIYDEVNPKQIPLGDLLTLVRKPQNNETVDKVYRNRIRSRQTAIRAFCVLCIGGSPKAVRMCVKVDCPLWLFRLGSNPFRRD